MSAITLKSTKANFINIHRQIRHYKRVCNAQDTGSHTQSQGHSYRSKVKLLNYVPVNTPKVHLNVTEK